MRSQIDSVIWDHVINVELSSSLLKRSSKVRLASLAKENPNLAPYDMFIDFPSKWSEIHWSCCTKIFPKDPLASLASSLCGWLDGLTADSGIDPHQKLQLCRTSPDDLGGGGEHWGMKEMNQPPATWQPPLYLECYMIMHCKLGLSPLVGGS